MMMMMISYVILINNDNIIGISLLIQYSNIATTSTSAVTSGVSTSVNTYNNTTINILIFA